MRPFEISWQKKKNGITEATGAWIESPGPGTVTLDPKIIRAFARAQQNPQSLVDVS